MLLPPSMVSPARPTHRMLLSAVAAWLLAVTPVGRAGPPIVIDDPETLDRGQVELFTSFQFTKIRSLRTWETPVELTIGLAPGLPRRVSLPLLFTRGIYSCDNPVLTSTVDLAHSTENVLQTSSQTGERDKKPQRVYSRKALPAPCASHSRGTPCDCPTLQRAWLTCQRPEVSPYGCRDEFL